MAHNCWGVSHDFSRFCRHYVLETFSKRIRKRDFTVSGSLRRSWKIRKCWGCLSGFAKVHKPRRVSERTLATLLPLMLMIRLYTPVSCIPSHLQPTLKEHRLGRDKTKWQWRIRVQLMTLASALQADRLRWASTGTASFMQSFNITH